MYTYVQKKYCVGKKPIYFVFPEKNIKSHHPVSITLAPDAQAGYNFLGPMYTFSNSKYGRIGMLPLYSSYYMTESSLLN